MNINTPAPSFTNGTNDTQWPGADFAPIITLNVTSGQITVTGVLSNVSAFIYGTPSILQATCQLWINGTPSTLYTIDSQTGSISGPPTPVSPGDDVTIRFEAKATIPVPYDNQVVQRQDLSWTVPAGNGSIVFDTTTNPQQAPGWESEYFWDNFGSGPLKWAHTPIATDGTTRDLTIVTALGSGGSQSTSSFDQSPTAGQQAHTAAFDEAAAIADGSFQVWLYWSNNDDNRESLIALLYRDPAQFSSLGRFQQSNVGGAARWEP
ncbi:MAG: hypothetical protein AAFV53_38210 [Myxococcota bacterium]